jgi:hypothetical protein
MMATIIWTLFAVAVMIGIFAGCVVVVAVGVRWFEGALAKRRAKGAA